MNSGKESLVGFLLEAFKSYKYVLRDHPSYFAKPVWKISIFRWIFCSFIDDIMKDKTSSGRLVCRILEAFHSCKYVLRDHPSSLLLNQFDDIMKENTSSGRQRRYLLMHFGIALSMTFWKIRYLWVIDLDIIGLDKMRKGWISCVKVSWISLQEGLIRLLDATPSVWQHPDYSLRSTPEKHTFKECVEKHFSVSSKV